MANILLYYRTTATKKSDSRYSNPDNLPTLQKLSFTVPDDIMMGIQDTYNNNIIKKIIPYPKGRRIIQKDEGFAGLDYTLHGDYIISSGDSRTKLHQFRILEQSDSYHIYGIFGLKYPNGPSYLSVDPTNTQGLMINGTNSSHIGLNKKIMDFSIRLSFGGNIV